MIGSGWSDRRLASLVAPAACLFFMVAACIQSSGHDAFARMLRHDALAARLAIFVAFSGAILTSSVPFAPPGALRRVVIMATIVGGILAPRHTTAWFCLGLLAVLSIGSITGAWRRNSLSLWLCAASLAISGLSAPLSPSLTLLSAAGLIAFAGVRGDTRPGHEIFVPLLSPLVPFVTLRIGLATPSASLPLWYGGWVLVSGAGCAALGAIRSAASVRVAGAILNACLAHQGLALMSVGGALLARGSDLPVAMTLGGEAALVLSLAGSLATAVALSGRHLDRMTRFEHLGARLAHRPIAALCLACGGASLAFAPFLPGFSGIWLFMQTLLGAPRAGFAAKIGVVLIVGLTGWILATLIFSLLRLIALAWPSAPEPNRPAAAHWTTSASELLHAGILLSLGLFPWIWRNALLPAFAVPGLPTDVARLSLQPDMSSFEFETMRLVVFSLSGALAIVLWRSQSRYRTTRVTSAAWGGHIGAPCPVLPSNPLPSVLLMYSARTRRIGQSIVRLAFALSPSDSDQATRRVLGLSLIILLSGCLAAIIFAST